MGQAMFGRLLRALIWLGLASSATALAQSDVQEGPPVNLPTGSSSSENANKPDVGAGTAEEWAAACDDWDDWEKAGPPFTVVPRLHYVGTCGITALLVVTRDGNVLIDTGTRAGAKLILENVDKTLVDKSWIRLILTSHEHFDHVGGLAQIQRVTGAPALSSPIGAAVIHSGIADPDDPQAGMHEPMEPARAIIPLSLGKSVRFGGIDFMPISTPGHTPGALSWHWEMCGQLSYEPVDETEECTSVVYADSLSPVSRRDYRFSDRPEYVAEYRTGLQRLREVECDILLTPHPSASKMLERAATGSLEGGMTCVEYADAVERRLDARLAKEASE